MPEQAALAQVVARGRLDDAEVLADHDRAGARGLQHQDADERLVVVADVGTLDRTHAVGDPPEPEEADDVVDAQAAGVLAAARGPCRGTGA